MSTITATARLIMHRAAQVRTWGDLLNVGDMVGVDRSLPVAVYLRTVRWRLTEMALLANSTYYLGGWYRFSAN